MRREIKFRNCGDAVANLRTRVLPDPLRQPAFGRTQTLHSKIFYPQKKDKS